MTATETLYLSIMSHLQRGMAPTSTARLTAPCNGHILRIQEKRIAPERAFFQAWLAYASILEPGHLGAVEEKRSAERAFLALSKPINSRGRWTPSAVPARRQARARATASRGILGRLVYSFSRQVT